jgi:N-acetylglutamate synthase-like GNAT family acetyltransferase
MIRECSPDETDLICEIINDAAVAYKGNIPDDCRHDPYMPKEELITAIRDGVKFYGYLDNSELVGVMGIQEKKDVTLIRHAYVRNGNRRAGIGSALLSELRKKAKNKILIGTWAAATWAIKFYQKNGFELVSIEEKNRLLRKYWDISARQIETSVVLKEKNAARGSGWRQGLYCFSIATSRLLASPALTVALLLVLASQIVYGTLFQAGHGVYEAQREIFNSWFFLIGGAVPFPGVTLVVACLFINLVAAAAGRARRTWKAIGLLFIHAGIAVLFVNAAFGSFLRQETMLALREGESSNLALLDDMQNVPEQLTLPVTMHLNEFVIKRHPGSSAIMDFESRVHAQGEGIDRDVVISMNRPFRYRDYTFYQSSYRADNGQKLSILAVVKDPARIVPYIASIFIAAGLLVHFLFAFAAWPGRRHG